ncbi:MAG: cobalt/nickel transport system ATP-binding protein [Desulfonauticus sp.]|jgi:cobalt/nickel transport system ATP-binding protein|nr:cobalt/nickel transport system ATP-binding protein [Desulfonauticus sp.]
MKPLVSLKNISFGYKREKPLLQEINLQLFPQEKIGLIGPNGAGKTTLAFLITGLIQPWQGEIEVLGQVCKEEKDFQKIRSKIGFVFQNADDQLIFPTVLEDVAFGPLNQGLKPEQALEKAKKTLKQLNIERLASRNTFNLSGGEKKIVSIATVLSMEPQMLILDEPTVGLDENSRDKLIEILNNLELAYLIISHDYDFLARTTDKQLILKDKKIIYDPSVVLHKHEHAHPLGYVYHTHK